MIDKAINIVRRSIMYAEDAGTYEVSEELKPLEEILVRCKCRTQMEFNGMTGYCVPGSCVNWHQCSQENGFNVHGVDVADHVNKNWFAGTGIQPSRHVLSVTPG